MLIFVLCLKMSAKNFGFCQLIHYKLHAKNRYTAFLKTVERYSNFDRETIFYALVMIVVLYLTLGEKAEIICNICGIIYPACASVIAIQEKNCYDVKRLLIYWIVFASLRVIEFVAKFVVGYVPFYWVLKMTVLVFCFAPVKDNTSLNLYRTFLQPFTKQILQDGSSKHVINKRWRTHRLN